MIGQILSTMLPVFLIAGCGALYGRYRTPDIQGLNVLNMELFVPMLVFAVLADQQAPLQEYGWLALAATVVVLGSGVILYPVAKLLKLNLKRRVLLLLKVLNTKCSLIRKGTSDLYHELKYQELKYQKCEGEKKDQDLD